MASRQYRRNNRGQFASAGSPGTKVTTGRAGGFANAAHQQRVAGNRAASRQRKALVRKGVKVAAGAAATGAVGAVARRGVKNNPTGQSLGDVANTIKKAVRGGS
jgi:hypothetical protein